MLFYPFLWLTSVSANVTKAIERKITCSESVKLDNQENNADFFYPKYKFHPDSSFPPLSLLRADINSEKKAWINRKQTREIKNGVRDVLMWSQIYNHPTSITVSIALCPSSCQPNTSLSHPIPQGTSQVEKVKWRGETGEDSPNSSPH